MYNKPMFPRVSPQTLRLTPTLNPKPYPNKPSSPCKKSPTGQTGTVGELRELVHRNTSSHKDTEFRVPIQPSRGLRVFS